MSFEFVSPLLFFFFLLILPLTLDFAARLSQGTKRWKDDLLFVLLVCFSVFPSKSPFFLLFFFFLQLCLSLIYFAFFFCYYYCSADTQSQWITIHTSLYAQRRRRRRKKKRRNERKRQQTYIEVSKSRSCSFFFFFALKLEETEVKIRNPWVVDGGSDYAPLFLFSVLRRRRVFSHLRKFKKKNETRLECVSVSPLRTSPCRGSNASFAPQKASTLRYQGNEACSTFFFLTLPQRNSSHFPFSFFFFFISDLRHSIYMLRNWYAIPTN